MNARGLMTAGVLAFSGAVPEGENSPRGPYWVREVRTLVLPLGERHGPAGHREVVQRRKGLWFHRRRRRRPRCLRTLLCHSVLRLPQPGRGTARRVRGHPGQPGTPGRPGKAYLVQTVCDMGWVGPQVD